MDGLRILYVEDDPADWELTRRHLERAAPDLKLQRAETVAEALDQLAAGNVDLVLSDYRLPDGTGLNLVEAIRAREFRVPVVLVTGSGDADTAVRLLKAGAADYVVKQDDYLTTLPAVLEGAFRWFQSTDELRHANLRILYAEHDVADVELTQRAFAEHAGHVQLDVVWRATEVLRRLRAVPYDLLLLDYRLPDMLGIEVLKALREARIRVPVVMMTGQGDEDTAVQAMKLGAADYIVKRESYLGRLPTTLERVLIQRQLEDEKNALLALTELTRSLTALRDVHELAYRVVRAAVDVLHAEAALLWRAEGEGLAPAAWIGIDAAVARQLTARQLTVGPVGPRAVVERRVNVRELLGDSATGAGSLGDPAHALAVALVSGGQVVGALAVAGVEARRFRSTEERLLTILADHATVAVENARLYGQVRQQLDEIERTQARLVQTEKVAAMGQILAGVAHELNNPLSVVVGHAVLLREQLGGTPYADRLGKMENAADRCARIVKSFLSLARQRPPQREVVDLNQIIREAAGLLAYPLRVDDVEVVYHLEPNMPTLWADPHQIHQVLVNLIGNAHHAMRATAPPRRLTLTSRRAPAAHRVVLEVADTGPGVPAELRERIFEPFFTTKPVGEGTGLGLSLCRSGIESHGGTLTLESGPGAGAVFRIELPVSVRPLEPGADSAAPPTAGARKRILVVEDEPDVAEVLVDLLTSEGHEVDTAADGVAAMEKIGSRRYEVIMADMRMPRLDGPGLYRRIERERPELRRAFVFLTGDVLRPETRDFLQQVAAPTLSKPFDLEEVRRIVR